MFKEIGIFKIRISCLAHPDARPDQFRDISHNLATENNQTYLNQGLCYLAPEKGCLPVEHGQEWKAGRLFENHRIVVMATGCSNSPPLPAARRLDGIRWGRIGVCFENGAEQPLEAAVSISYPAAVSARGCLGTHGR